MLLVRCRAENHHGNSGGHGNRFTDHDTRIRRMSHGGDGGCWGRKVEGTLDERGVGRRGRCVKRMLSEKTLGEEDVRWVRRPLGEEDVGRTGCWMGKTFG